MKKMIMSLGLLKFFLFFLLFSKWLLAEPLIVHNVVLKILDKTTNKVYEKKIDTNSVIDWFTLNIQIYTCYKTPPEEIPEDYVLLEVRDYLDENKKYIYRGWMISSSPDVTPLEHPIYDLWLSDCNINNN